MKRYNTSILNPAWVTGFIDGEGTFYVGLQPKLDIATGYQVMLQFTITQHIRDQVLIAKLVEFFNCGYLIKDSSTKIQFRIRNFDHLSILFELLDSYPLQTQKALDAQAFRQVYVIMLNKEHLASKGIRDIQIIKTSINRGRIHQYKQ